METKRISQSAFMWALQGLCALQRKPFATDLAMQQLAPPYTAKSFSSAVAAYGFDAVQGKAKPEKLHKESFPLIVWLSAKPASTDLQPVPAELGDASGLQWRKT